MTWTEAGLTTQLVKNIICLALCPRSLEAMSGGNTSHHTSELTNLADAKNITAKSTIHKSCPLRCSSHRITSEENPHSSSQLTAAHHYRGEINKHKSYQHPTRHRFQKLLHYIVIHTRTASDSFLCTQIAAHFPISDPSHRTSELSEPTSNETITLQSRTTLAQWTLHSIPIRIPQAATYEDLKNSDDAVTT